MSTTQCPSCQIVVDMSSVQPGAGAACPGCGLALVTVEPSIPVVPPPPISPPTKASGNPPLQRIPDYAGLTQIFLAMGLPLAAIVDNAGTARFPILTIAVFGVLVSMTGVQIVNRLTKILHELRLQSPGPR